MSRKKCIIIGSGLGGLSCGFMLARNGFDVTVLEQHSRIGGCLQCFSRDGARFETGMHFIGSADPGQTLHRLMRYLKLDSISLDRLDTSAYDVVSLAGERFRFANGRERFIDTMSAYFPSQRDNIVRYRDLIDNVANASSLHSLRFAQNDEAISSYYQNVSINSVMDSIFDDAAIRNVLCGNLPLYAGRKDMTPFARHAFIMDFYNNSAFRIVGGSDIIASSLARSIEGYGGEVRTCSKVSGICCDDSHATGVEINDSEFMPADIVIADIHPNRLLELIDSRLIRPAFRKRILSIPNTTAGFTVYLRFRPSAVPYLNSNFYAYDNPSPWGCEEYDEATWPKGYLYMHFCHEPQPRFAQSGVILAYMDMKDVARWKGSSVGHRGEDYEDFKRHKAEALIDRVEKDFPGLKEGILSYYTASPLTYLDYTGTESGSIYGIAADVTLGATGRVSHKTKIPNLLLTGQNVNSHGMLGVLVGSILTCSELLSAEYLLKQINEDAT